MMWIDSLVYLWVFFLIASPGVIAA